MPKNTHTPAPRRRLAAAGASLAAGGLVAAGLLGPTALAPAAAAPVDEILPPPQEVTQEGTAVDLSGEVTIVAADDVDAAALAELQGIVAAAGGTATVEDAAPAAGSVVHLGTGTAAVEDALAALGVAGTEDLEDEGYVLANGEVDDADTLVLAGADARGTYYATQTLRQVVTDGVVPAAHVRDYPLMPIRGTIEGFYGIPWSHEARLDLLEFSGEHKLNTYIYTPKDDRLLRAEWRDLYEGDELARMAELIEQAGDHHVDFTFALSPANDICYSSEEDYQATIAKFEQLRDLGVDSFYVALDDIPLNFHCDADRELYPDEGNWHWLADAQTDYLNRLQTEWIEPNGLADLQTVPTNYYGSNEDPYKARFGEFLDDDIRVQWTGEGVFSDTITVESVERAVQSYRTDHLYIWDNFPVNDGRRDRLFLNPLTGRDPQLYEHIDGFTSNPMIQPYASWPSLANYADYTWNGPDYDPEVSMAAVLRELAGADAEVQEALTAFVDLNQSWPYPLGREGQEFAPELSADIDAFWAAREAGEDSDGALADRLALIRAMPQTLAQMAEPGFYGDAEPWIDAAAQWATALEHDIEMIEALAQDYGVPAAEAFLAAREQIALTGEATVDDQGWDGILHEDALVPTVGDGVFDEFDAEARAILGEWLGVDPAAPVEGYPATASSSMGTYQSNSVDLMTDGDLDTLYWSDEAGQAGDYVQVDLGEPQEVGRVAVHQADSDDQSGDMFYDATLQYSLDGEDWVDAGVFADSSLVVADFDEPVTARYVRLVANSSNSGGQWIKVREFIVSSGSTVYETNLPSSDGAGVSRAFDGDVASAYQASGTPEEGSFISYTFTDPEQVGSVSVLGTGAGEIQLSVDGEWVTVGSLSEDVPFHEAAADDVSADGVRLVFTEGSPAPQIYEVVTRAEGPIGVEEPTEEPTDEPTTDEPTEEPTTDQPTEEPTTDQPTEEPTTGQPTEPGTDPTTDDGSPAPTAPGTGPGDDGGQLPSTGADLTGMAAAAVTVLLGASLAVLAYRRREA